MPIDRRLVLQQTRFVRSMRHRHNVDVAKFRPGFTPIAMGQNLVPPRFPAGFHLAARRHRPVKEGVEAGHAHSAGRRFDVLQKRRKAADDLSLRQVLRDREKFP